MATRYHIWFYRPVVYILCCEEIQQSNHCVWRIWFRPFYKDTAHLLRSNGVVGPEVNFIGSMPLTSKKEHFLVNSRNKQKIIFMLSDRFEDNSIKTIHATSDADLLICQTAVDSTSRCRTTLMGEETDLLVLLSLTSILGLKESRPPRIEEFEILSGYNKHLPRHMSTFTICTCNFWLSHNIKVVWYWESSTTYKVER